MKPFSSDVESFVLIDPDGKALTCSREENSELFRLVAGGYGLFGVVTSVKLRLTRRQKIERVVEIGMVDDVMEAFEQRISDGFIYGDFQFSIDEKSEDFLRRGVFSCYRPVDPATPIPQEQKQLAKGNWEQLLYLAHSDKAQVFDEYSQYYLSTSGQLYWSDTHQLSTYLDDYHVALDARLKANNSASEMITEIYVPRDKLADFLAEAADDFIHNNVNVIYGTIRLIERDDDSFLAWAREPFVCTIFNLHTEHSPEGLEHSANAFRRLIDMAIRRGGSYFLTYHLNYALPVHLVRAEPPGTIWGPPKTWGKKVGWQRFQLRQSTPRRSPKWLPNENSIAPEGPSNKAPARGPRGPIKSGLPRPITSVARI